MCCVTTPKNPEVAGAMDMNDNRTDGATGEPRRGDGWREQVRQAVQERVPARSQEHAAGWRFEPHDLSYKILRKTIKHSK